MKSSLSSLLIAIAIIVSAVLFANAFKNRNKANNSIAVTGLGSKDFVSDLIVWSGSFIRKNTSLKEAYATLDSDRENIKRYLESKGIKPENLVFSAIDINKEFEDVFDNAGNKIRSQFTGYRLSQNVQIESADVNKIETISRQVSELINSGIEFYSEKPQYYYTKLAELKIEMIAEATKDANIRAKKIAENAGGRVGRLKKADMGVFQIVAQNSAEEYSWGGSFNTTSKRKTATITVKLQYETD
ncbi:MAG TPA: SIMPL domain-containing protein [Chitinophagaceae bacterium]|nr:SIMPL domain-containing protein [Chitinophagaceae bacterium]